MNTPAARRSMVVTLLVFLLLVAACGSDGSDRVDRRPASEAEACGLTCRGAVTCSNGTSGAASVQAGSCVLEGDAGTMKLTCDGKVVAIDPQGVPANGTWTRNGVRQIDVSLGAVRYASCDLDAEVAQSNAGARYPGVGDPCRFTTECPGYQGTGSPLACNTDSGTCCIQRGWNLQCGSTGDCCGGAECRDGTCCQRPGALCTQDTDCCSGSCNDWNWNCN